MIRALYSSATGMKAQELLIDVAANNIANVNTNGFKRSQLDFADLFYSTLKRAGNEVATGQINPTGLQIGSGVRPVGTTKLMRPGSLESTGNPTDLAIEGDGFFKVQTPSGEFRYTRDGSFRTDAQGRLVTGDGFLVDGGITIPPDATNISVGNDGTVSGVQAGVSTQLGQLLVVRFPNPAGLSSEGSNMYSANTASGNEVQGIPGTDGLGMLRQQFLERSNVEVVTELISLITAQRAYEVNSRAIRAGDEMLSTSTDILR